MLALVGAEDDISLSGIGREKTMAETLAVKD